MFFAIGISEGCLRLRASKHEGEAMAFGSNMEYSGPPEQRQHVHVIEAETRSQAAAAYREMIPDGILRD